MNKARSVSRRKYAERVQLYLAAAVLGLFVCVGAFGSALAPLSPTQQNLNDRLLPPFSGKYLLGTDNLGRDILSQLLAGSRVSLVVGIVAVTISVLIGLLVGLVSGFLGGWIDTVLMRIVDAWLAFPFLLLAIAIVAFLGPGLPNIVGALAITEWVIYVRVIRGEVLSLRERDFVLAARALGVTRRDIVLRHILAHVMPSVVVMATLRFGVVIVTQASLAFLGLGVQADTPTWGSMLADGESYVSTAWWLALIPGLTIFVVVLAINVVGDAARDLLDPKFRSATGDRGGARRYLSLVAPRAARRSNAI